MLAKKWQDGGLFAASETAVRRCLDAHAKGKTVKEFNQLGPDLMFSSENVEVLVDRMNTKFSGKQVGNKESKDAMKDVLVSSEKENGTICLKSHSPSKTTIIRWKNQDFCFTCLPTFCTNLNKIFDRACRLGKLDGTSTRTANVVCPMHRQKLERLKIPLFAAFKAIVEASPFLKPHRVHRTINRAGVHGLSNGSHGTVIKCGMSFDCFTRADSQSPKFAFKMADCNHLRHAVIPAWIIQEIESIGLPGITHHKDHIERTRDLIAMQICEGHLAAAHENNDDSTCVTQTIFERLVQEPPRLDNLACEESILAQGFLSDLCGDRAHAILSWPTMKSIVHGIADESHSQFIGRRLREQPEDGFVTLHWLKAVLGGDNLCGWENALPIPPEQSKLDGFLQAASGIRGSGHLRVSARWDFFFAATNTFVGLLYCCLFHKKKQQFS